MRRIYCALAMLLMLCLTAHAEDDNRVAEGLPVLTITWCDTGESTGNDRRPYLLAADIAAEDGSLTQTITWESNEHPDFERIAPFVRLVDYNFDGYKDLQLLTAQGARNVFYAVALWDVEEGRFWDVERHCLHLPGGEIAQEITQVEFCNPEFYLSPYNPDFGYVYCVEADGYAYRTEHVYGWESRYGLTTYFVSAMYDAGDGLIGESLEQWGTGLCYWWNQTYPEDWYYGADGPGADAKRTEARRLLMLGRGTVDSYSMQVCNTSWVNLRQLDSKDSPSLAQLRRGTTVQVLATGCGEDGGWVLVYVHGDGTSDDDREMEGMTGYIWHSYLEPWTLFVANVDWVNVREEADKQSASVAQLEEGTRVHRCAGDEKNGWVPIYGWHTDGTRYSGYIWHSYLEPEEFIPWEDAP